MKSESSFVTNVIEFVFVSSQSARSKFSQGVKRSKSVQDSTTASKTNIRMNIGQAVQQLCSRHT
jgi:hypothetical protein